jgi:hypothetical protein
MGHPIRTTKSCRVISRDSLMPLWQYLDMVDGGGDVVEWCSEGDMRRVPW